MIVKSSSSAVETERPVVSIAIVNFNSGTLLERCLRAIAAQSFRRFEVLVVDNASADNSVAPARAAVRADPRFVFQSLQENVGFAQGNNRAARGARGEWFATLNPDAFPAPDWLEQLMQATARHPGVEMFGSTQIDAGDPTRLDGCGDVYFGFGYYWRGGHGHPRAALPPEGRAFSVCGAAALYRTDRFLELGGFDERFFCIGEDVDLGFRWRLIGGEAIQVRAAVVHHVGSATMGRSSTFSRYYAARNMLWTFIKNMPSPLFWLLLPPHPALLALRLALAWRRGDLAPVMRGTFDALRHLPEIWRERRRIQAGRVVSNCAIARAMCWSPQRAFFAMTWVRGER